jgi:L-amino acid N-acyltransferase YncA
VFIDPVATVSWRKREGLGRAAVAASLRSLHEVGVAEVGAVITDGNTASERLFTSLGARRVVEMIRASRLADH